MRRRAEIQFHLPVLFRLFDPFLSQNFFDAGFDVLGASSHVLGGAVAEEAFGKLVAAICLAAFFHLGQPTDMSCGRAELGDLILLVLIGLGLFLAFGQFLFEIIGVIARIGFAFDAWLDPVPEWM